MKAVVVLEITSWRGSIGAEHYYGHLISDLDSHYKRHELMRQIDQAEADYLNEKDHCEGRFLAGKRGWRQSALTRPNR